jgi:hypothetical protein
LPLLGCDIKTFEMGEIYMEVTEGKQTCIQCFGEEICRKEMRSLEDNEIGSKLVGWKELD